SEVPAAPGDSTSKVVGSAEPSVPSSERSEELGARTTTPETEGRGRREPPLPKGNHPEPQKATLNTSKPIDDEPGDRVYAKGRFVWIQAKPGDITWIGYLTLGDSVRLYEGGVEKAKTASPGCDGLYRIEPRGYVCVGAEATLDPNDPEYIAIAAHK